jgi:hypothetical protein
VGRFAHHSTAYRFQLLSVEAVYSIIRYVDIDVLMDFAFWEVSVDGRDNVDGFNVDPLLLAGLI